MKSILTSIAFITFCSLAKAQKNDTTIYSGCKLATDTTLTIGNPSILDKCPQFKNGLDYFNIYIYIDTHIRYNSITKPPDSQKRLIIEMVIEKDGSISHLKIIRSVSKEFDKQVLSIANSSPKWQPGILHGKSVRVRQFVAVSFKSSGKKS